MTFTCNTILNISDCFQIIYINHLIVIDLSMTDWKTTVVVLFYTLRLLITPLVSLNFINKPYWIPKGQSKRTIQRNGNKWCTRRRKTKQKHNTIYVGHQYTQASTNNVNKTCALLQTTWGKDKPNIVFEHFLSTYKDIRL
jgi:hypothetical protein